MPMFSINLTEGIGFVAAACTTMAFVPQLIKIRKQGGRDLSYVMLSVYLLGLGLWLVYGLRLHAAAVIAANVVGILLVGTALLLKREMERGVAGWRKPTPSVIEQDAVCYYDNPLLMTPAYLTDRESKKLQAAAHSASRS